MTDWRTISESIGHHHDLSWEKLNLQQGEEFELINTRGHVVLAGRVTDNDKALMEFLTGEDYMPLKDIKLLYETQRYGMSIPARAIR